jgi:hypothetical protein
MTKVNLHATAIFLAPASRFQCSSQTSKADNREPDLNIEP